MSGFGIDLSSVNASALGGRRPRLLLWILAGVLLVALPVLGLLQMRWAQELQDAEVERTRLEVDEALGEMASGMGAELVRWNAAVQAVSIGAVDQPHNPRPEWPTATGLGPLVQAAYVEVPGLAGAGTDASAAGAAPTTWFVLPPRGPAVAVPPPDFAEQIQAWRREKTLPGLLPRSVDDDRMVLSARVPFDGRTLEVSEASAELLARAPVLWMVMPRDRVAEWVESWASESWRWHRRHLDYWLLSNSEAEGEDPLFGSRSDPPESRSDLLHATVDLNQAFGETLRLLANPEGRRSSAPTPDPEGAEVVLRDGPADAIASAPEPVVFVTLPSGRDGWRLEVKVHRNAVDARLRQLWRHNLAIGLAALGVLGVAVALLMVLTVNAQRLARAQFDFVTGVTHELRTPLSVLRSASANLSDGVVTDEAQVRRYGQVMKKEVRRLGDLIDRILGLTRTDTVGVPEADVRASVERVLERLGDEIADSGARVRVDVASELPPLRAHPWALDSLLHNLVGNALKYGGGEISVEAGPARLRLRPAVEVSVRDRGQGLSRRERRRVFEPFFRGRRAVDEQKPGTGLGLSWVARLAQRYGGRVVAESEPGVGSRFGIALPVASPAGEAP